MKKSPSVSGHVRGRRAAATAPEPTAKAIRAALANHRAGRSDAAEAALGRILEDDPDHLGALEAAAAIASERGHYDTVAAYCRRALRHAPDRGDLHKARGAA